MDVALLLNVVVAPLKFKFLATLLAPAVDFDLARNHFSSHDHTLVLRSPPSNSSFLASSSTRNLIEISGNSSFLN